uniref:M48 family metallopeptidase n=1 Tax=Actibacterium sp. TaxID=1872125 RepID=UPI0035648A1D
GEPSVEVQLRRSVRARRYSLRVSQLDGRVTLTLPERASLREGLDFLSDRADWVRSHLAARPQAMTAVLGGEVPFEGKLLPVRGVKGVRGPRIEDGALIVPPDEERAAQRIQAFLKQAARDRLAAASDGFAAQIGHSYRRLTLRDTRSRWGSCSVQGDLMYSWRLIMAPPEILTYVAAHEVAHLAEMNHSPAFWKVVAGLCPEYGRHRAWLKGNGQNLHRLRFGD